MSESIKIGKATSKDRLTARSLAWAPWLSFLLAAFPLPLFFLFLYFAATADAAVYILMALSSLAVGSIIGLIIAALFMLYRRRWLKRLRDRVAADGITADEIDWFLPELTGGERRALRQIEGQDALLADAYRETLAMRLTAARVTTAAKRDLLAVERRLNRASYIHGTDTTVLRQELHGDRARLERIRNDGAQRRAEAEARLQMIEAAASRGASWAETNFALQRLGSARGQLPVALEAARLEQQAREDIERDLLDAEQRITRQN